MRTVLALFVFIGISSVSRAADVELTVHLSVAGAAITLDGKEVSAAAPQDFKTMAAPGAHALKITKDGFITFEQQVELVSGTPARVEALLRVAGPETAPKADPKAKIAPPIRLAVYELQTQPGIDPRIASLLSEALLAEVRKLEKISAISMAEVKDMLSFEQQRQLLGCEQDACIAEIGGALGVDELVTGSMGAIGESQLVTIRRVDMKIAQVKTSVQKRFKSTDGEEFLAIVGPSIEELFAEYPLRAGRTRGVSQDTLARLNPPPLPKWAFFTTAGGAALAGLAGAFFGAQFLSAQDEYDKMAQASVQTPVAAKTLKDVGDRATSNASAANVGFGVAGVLLVAAGVESLFTDWHGYGDAKPAGAVAILPTPNGAVFAARF